jgi:hypothetical protein
MLLEEQEQSVAITGGLLRFVNNRPGPARFDDCRNAAAGAEVSFDVGPNGIAGLHNVFEDLVDDILLEDAEIAVGEEIFLPRLEFEAALTRHVAELDDAEVGQSGLGTDRGKLGIVDEDFVGRELVLPGFDRGKGEVEAGLGVLVGVARDGGFGDRNHIDIVGQRCAVPGLLELHRVI